VLNWTADEIAAATAMARANGHRPPSGAQLAYSVLQREPVETPAMSQACADGGIGVVASYSLQGGLLSGKYRGGLTEGRLTGHLADARVQPMLPKVEAFLAIAAAAGCTPSQLALAYCLKQPQVASVVFGSRSVTQLRDNLGALAVASRLDDDTLAALRRL
jgi:aryl-alcohol dehydrogenase-like predicted oxidoreductase